MNKLILATGSNLGYLNKIGSYLKSIESNSNFDSNYLMFLGDDKLQLDCKKIEVLNVDIKDIESLNSIFCIQHGEFFKSKELMDATNDDDVIFFTDGDMWLQRPLTDTEILKFKNFKDDDVFVGYNASPKDTLYDEANRLGYKGYHSKFLNYDLKNIKIFNTGVLAMNKKTWLKLVKIYIENYSEIDKTFHHYAKQQWLISFIIGTENFNIIEMGYNLHNHTHYESPVGTKIDNNGIVTYNNKIVLFKHKWY
jgi:hypothetical protein